MANGFESQQHTQQRSAKADGGRAHTTVIVAAIVIPIAAAVATAVATAAASAVAPLSLTARPALLDRRSLLGKIDSDHSTIEVLPARPRVTLMSGACSVERVGTQWGR